eukprot:482823-Amphidinium_carterae.1
MYAQIGMFPLNFQKELMTYYDESIAYMSDTAEDYRKVQQHCATMDVPYGSPDDLEIPSQVRVDWSRWAHERTVNAGYASDASQKWLLERDLDWKVLGKGNPPLTLRHQFDTPDGLFPQNWPDPDEPDEMNFESHLFAALVMDDYDNREPTDHEGRLREAALNLGIPINRLDAAEGTTLIGRCDEDAFQY